MKLAKDRHLFRGLHAPPSIFSVGGLLRKGVTSPLPYAQVYLKKAGHAKRVGENRGVHRVLVGKPEGKMPLGRPRRRWEDNIKMDLQEFGGGRGDWMELAQDRDGWRALVDTVRNFRVP